MRLHRKLSRKELEAANEDLLRRRREYLKQWEEGGVTFKPNGLFNTAFSISYAAIIFVIAIVQLGLKKIRAIKKAA